MIKIVFSFWFILFVLLLSVLPWELFIQSNISIQIVIICVFIWVIFTLLFACYHVCSFIFSIFYRFNNNIKKDYINTPSVAILYTCKNDFSEEAVKALLKQNYSNYDLYILDDSNDFDELQRINHFLEYNYKNIYLRRRNSTKGFKAGNINSAINGFGNRYKYVLIIDADEIVPNSFVRDLVAIAEANDRYVFIQSAHVQYGISEYSKATGEGLDLHWNYFLPARNKSGFLFFYGHGALFRLKELIKMGGIPEIVSEDIALTAILLSNGYKGYFAHKVVSSIEAPISFTAFRRKNKKIIQGTLEFYKEYSGQFFKSTKVKLSDKIDLILASLTIYLPILYLFFILFLHVLVPTIEIIENGFLKQTIYWDLAKFYSSDIFVGVVLFTIIAPLSYTIPSIIRRPIKSFLSIFRMGSIYLAGTIFHTMAFNEWLINKNVEFIPTGDRSKKTQQNKFNKLEFFIGLLLLIISIVMKVPFLLALGLSLVFIPIILKNNLKTRLSRFLTLIPFLVIFLILFNQPIEAIGIIGVTGFMAIANP